MFFLHDHTRRALCRLGFLGLCLAPTVSVLAWGVRHHLPSHLAAVSREVSILTDCSAEVGRVTHPRPGVTILHAVTLSDPSTGDVIARVDQLMIDERGDVLRIKATRPTASADGLPRLWNALSRYIERWEGEQPLEFAAGTVELASSYKQHEFQDLQARLQISSAGPQFDAQFRHVGGELAEPAEIHITDDRPKNSRTFDLATGSQPFPCLIASVLLPELAALGSEAAFQGRVSAEATRGGG
jgi:hypothetical protein